MEGLNASAPYSASISHSKNSPKILNGGSAKINPGSGSENFKKKKSPNLGIFFTPYDIWTQNGLQEPFPTAMARKSVSVLWLSILEDMGSTTRAWNYPELSI